MEKRFITYLGFGRGGIRTLDIVEKNMENADYMVCDTGYFHLRKSKIKNKILLTKETTSSIIFILLKVVYKKNLNIYKQKINE